MQFLKTLFWVLLAVVLVLFAKANWIPVELKMWGDIIVEIRLPFLILIVFLLGFLPPFVLHRTQLWTMRRRIEAQERQKAASPASAAPGQTDEYPVI